MTIPKCILLWVVHISYALSEQNIIHQVYLIHTQVQIFVNIFIESVHYGEENRFNN